VLVAQVAIRAVVYISVDIRVPEVGRVPAAVATSALENAVVIRIGMAGRAHSVRVSMVRGEPRVIERGSRPRRRVVAGSASLREDCWRR
jgi:hypothetical protein